MAFRLQFSIDGVNSNGLLHSLGMRISIGNVTMELCQIPLDYDWDANHFQRNENIDDYEEILEEEYYHGDDEYDDVDTLDGSGETMADEPSEEEDDDEEDEADDMSIVSISSASSDDQDVLIWSDYDLDSDF